MAIAKLFALHTNATIDCSTQECLYVVANFLTSLIILQPVEVLSHEGVSEYIISYILKASITDTKTWIETLS